MSILKFLEWFFPNLGVKYEHKDPDRDPHFESDSSNANSMPGFGSAILLGTSFAEEYSV
jgi:hypothetical protein